MADAPIAPKIHEALDAHGYFAAQITFDGKPRNFATDPFDFRLGQILDLDVRCDTRCFTDIEGTLPPNAKNMR